MLRMPGAQVGPSSLERQTAHTQPSTSIAFLSATEKCTINLHCFVENGRTFFGSGRPNAGSTPSSAFDGERRALSGMATTPMRPLALASAIVRPTLFMFARSATKSDDFRFDGLYDNWQCGTRFTQLERGERKDSK